MTTTPLPTNPGPAPRSNKLLIALIAAAGVLLLAVVAIVFLLIGRGGAQPTAGGDPTTAPIVTPTASPTPTTAPVGDNGGGTGGGGSGGGGGGSTDTTVRFTSFEYDGNVYCDPTGNEEKPSPSISWSSANAVAVYWTPNNQEANASNGYQVGASGNQDTMSASKGQGERYEFPCNHDQYFDTTITLVGADGQTVSKTVTFVDVNWGTGGDDDE